MPCSRAARGESMRAGRPSTRISPASGRVMPERMMISVDLPAPFSPSRQWTSPRRRATETSSFASTPGKRFVMPTSSTAGAAVSPPDGAPVDVGPVRLSDPVRSPLVLPRRPPKRPPRGLRASSLARLLLLDQSLDLSGLRRQRHLQRPAHDAPAGRRDLRPDIRRNVAGLEERDSAVRERAVVSMRSVLAPVDVGDRLLERFREAPEHRREQDALLVDRPHVPDVADEPDLVARLRGLDSLQIAEGRAVAHAEDDVGARCDHARDHALAAGRIVVAGRADRHEGDLDLLVDALDAGDEAAAHL